MSTEKERKDKIDRWELAIQQAESEIVGLKDRIETLQKWIAELKQEQIRDLPNVTLTRVLLCEQCGGRGTVLSGVYGTTREELITCSRCLGTGKIFGAISLRQLVADWRG